MKWLPIGTCGVLLAIGVTRVPAQSNSLFWSNRDRIQASERDGSNVQDLVSGRNTAADIELDLSAGKMYWTDISSRTVHRANLDGSAVETLISIGQLRSPIGLELDVTSGKMYWSDRTADKIQRANLDGSAIEDVVVGAALGNVYQLALDLVHGHIYWSAGLAKEIRRATLDGLDARIVTRTQTWTYGLALDPPHDRMYWTETTTGTLWTAHLDGTHAVAVHQFDATVRPLDLELDPFAAHVYVADNSRTRIWRTDWNGANAIPVVDLPDPPPFNLLGVAVTPSPRPPASLFGPMGSGGPGPGNRCPLDCDR